MTFAQIDEATDLAFLERYRGSGRLAHWIGGEEVAGGGDHQPVFCPWTGEELAVVPLAGLREVDRAVAAAAAAFPAWRDRNPRERAAVLLRFRTLLEAATDEIACSISAENGKTFAEAKAEVLKGIESVELAAALPHLLPGRISEVSPGIDCLLTREPLGVVASITPFNFPAMVPLWTIPLALAAGNAMILKPSEQVPMTPLRLARLLAEAGLPAGLFQVVHGGRDAVEAILDHPGIRAVSFVGSTPVARAVYRRGSASDKRVLALGGAKNHLIAMPDAEPGSTARAVLEAATGCAGQRCMAASVLVAVGESDALLERLAELARTLVVGRDMGAIISAPAAERIRGAIAQADRDGARIVVDGRAADLPPALAGGYWVAPTLLEGVRPGSAAARDEIFGPVLSVIRVRTLDEALEIENRSEFGNAAAVFTGSGAVAREVARRASAGMIGINVGIPVPRDPFGFGGWNESKFGVGDITGEGSLAFWTRDKKVTVRWNAG
ncbi:MAG: CoA-acylating methylmalonate-semialdehyde dehydrogenase [Thermoanaerobaculia bacterium]